jgi:hypothetical protein
MCPRDFDVGPCRPVKWRSGRHRLSTGAASTRKQQHGQKQMQVRHFGVLFSVTCADREKMVSTTQDNTEQVGDSGGSCCGAAARPSAAGHQNQDQMHEIPRNYPSPCPPPKGQTQPNNCNVCEVTRSLPSNVAKPKGPSPTGCESRVVPGSRIVQLDFGL